LVRIHLLRWWCFPATASASTRAGGHGAGESGYGNRAKRLDQGLAVNFDTLDNGGVKAPAIEIKDGPDHCGGAVPRPPKVAGITDPDAASRDVSQSRPRRTST